MNNLPTHLPTFLLNLSDKTAFSIILYPKMSFGARKMKILYAKYTKRAKGATT